MSRDNAPKARQLARRAQQAARRASYSRLLIVSEGRKTEPHYFCEIRALYRLHSANVEVQPSQLGTAPLQVVNYAHQLFERGDSHKGIRPRAFDQVCVVFDRDEHLSYFDALHRSAALDRSLRNDCGESVHFEAIPSCPSFELWLLLHYEDVQHPIHRDEVIRRLRRHIPGYAKGAADIFAKTSARIADATHRAETLSKRFTPFDAPEPYTAVARLVTRLVTLRS